jgi:hypothetical protein
LAATDPATVKLLPNTETRSMSLTHPSRAMNWTTRSLRLVLLAAAAMVLPGGAQNATHNVSPLPQPSAPIDMGDPGAEHRRMLALNRERQKSIVADTEKLLKLAGELDREVKGSGSDALTPDESRKLAAIEKLAHNVKDRMAYSLSEPSFDAPLPPHRPNY